MDIKDKSVLALENMGRWLLAEPNPHKHLQIGPQPCFRGAVRGYRGSDDDLLIDDGFSPDEAYECLRIIHMLSSHLDKRWLFAFYAEQECHGSRRATRKFMERKLSILYQRKISLPERTANAALDHAHGAFKELYCLITEMRKDNPLTATH